MRRLSLPGSDFRQSFVSLLVNFFFIFEIGFANGIEETVGNCRTGRLFLGSLSESNAEYIPITGIYEQLDSIEYNNRKVYKHIATDASIYFLSDRQFGQGIWAVGPYVGSDEPLLSLPARSASPVTSQQEWRLWNTTTQSWNPDRYLKLECVEKEFYPCTSGKILLSGISPRHAVQNKRMGVYVITNRTYNLRPVYKHRELDEFLFYTHETGGKWIIGPEVGRIVGGMFVLDFALRPEFIFQTWVVFVGRSFIYDHGVKVQCYGVGSDGTSIPDIDYERPVEVQINGGSAPDAGDISRIVHRRRNPLPFDIIRRKNEENSNEFCSLDCQNGGRCATTKDSVDICMCRDSYFGVNCQLEIDCGPDPITSDLETVSTTGHYFLDIIFYRCPANTITDGPPGVICQIDGTWSNPPRCLNGYHSITPEHEESMPPLPSTKTDRSMP